MPDDFTSADILLATTGPRGNPLVNVGEQTSGVGFGADTSVWGNADGFISVPNAANENGCAQALVTQDGSVKRAIAVVDNRYANKAGDLASGDRAIVSDSEAYLRLTRATDNIRIVSGDMTVELDGLTGMVTIARGESMITMSATGIALEVRAAPGPAPALASISLLPSGTVAIVAPVGVTVNGVPLVVP